MNIIFEDTQNSIMLILSEPCILLNYVKNKFLSKSLNSDDVTLLLV